MICDEVIIIKGAGITGLWLKVEASRRRSDPRKRGKVSVSTVRFRSKSCRVDPETEISERVFPG